MNTILIRRTKVSALLNHLEHISTQLESALVGAAIGLAKPNVARGQRDDGIIVGRRKRNVRVVLGAAAVQVMLARSRVGPS